MTLTMRLIAALFLMLAAIAAAQAQPATRGMRAGTHADFGRLVFAAPGGGAYQVEQDGQRVILRFAESAPLAPRPGRNPARNVLSIEEADGAVVIVAAPGATLRHYRVGDRVVLDFHDAAGAAAPVPRPRAEAAPRPRAEAGTRREPPQPLAPRDEPRGRSSEGDQVDITTVAVEGRTAAECAAVVGLMYDRAQVLSDATSPPYGLSPNLRAFHDSVLRLSSAGDVRSLNQLSHAYVVGYSPTQEPLHAFLVTFVRVEVTRPPGTPTSAPSRIAIAWMWLERLAETRDSATGLMVAQPRMHRFDFSGPLAPRYGAWGRARAECRAGAEGSWFGAVAVWTYLPP